MRFSADSIFKKGSLLGLSVALAAGLLWWSLPLAITRSTDIARGEELSHRLEDYYTQHKTMPTTDDWPVLRQLGFTERELESAYPQYRKINDVTYELIFVEGFDGPYLMWNSSEREWKMSH